MHKFTIAPMYTVAPQPPADGAWHTIRLIGNAAQRAARITQGVDSISFKLAQAAMGHEQRHLALKGLKLGRMDLFNASGIAFQS